MKPGSNLAHDLIIIDTSIIRDLFSRVMSFLMHWGSACGVVFSIPLPFVWIQRSVNPENSVLFCHRKNKNRFSLN